MSPASGLTVQVIAPANSLVSSLRQTLVTAAKLKPVYAACPWLLGHSNSSEWEGGQIGSVCSHRLSRPYVWQLSTRQVSSNSQNCSLRIGISGEAGLVAASQWQSADIFRQQGSHWRRISPPLRMIQKKSCSPNQTSHFNSWHLIYPLHEPALSYIW